MSLKWEFCLIIVLKIVCVVKVLCNAYDWNTLSQFSVIDVNIEWFWLVNTVFVAWVATYRREIERLRALI